MRCLVSIGTGVPALRPVRDDLATETEKTAEQFRRDKADLDDEGRYYRFNASHCFEDVGLEKLKKKREIAAVIGCIRGAAEPALIHSGEAWRLPADPGSPPAYGARPIVFRYIHIRPPGWPPRMTVDIRKYPCSLADRPQ
ncbi:hypothetical protein B0J15DRAFT_144211 [Fusarium solani]|uniref:Uncharacterized protein n=1 Tax=Fusarium solani TaxID=169388 RepID=A0A9P9JZ08_FUSSL|nr:uncharacterized protein B0J15DRAFT_144211 [Fusarium solani]KAH7237915.1 hypothetical protein B0J15DRAFT_144211 [Fusarium solani]